MLHFLKSRFSITVILVLLCISGCSTETVTLDSVLLQKDAGKTRIFVVVDAPSAPTSPFLEDAIHANASLAIKVAEKHAIESDSDDVVIFLREPDETTTGMSHETSIEKLQKYKQQTLEEFDKGVSRGLLWKVSAKLPENMEKASLE